MKITQEELIEMICEGVNRKVHSLIDEGHRNILKESDMIKMVEETLLEYMFTSDDSVYGSDNFDYDAEYDAIDYETMQDVLESNGWFYTDAHVLNGKSGKTALRFVLEYRPQANTNIQQLYSELKSRAMYPEGVRMFKNNEGYPVLVVYRYKNK